MRIFFDPSSLVKRYVEEKGSEEVLRLCGQATELGLSVICFPEIISALSRLRREKKLAGPEYVRAKHALIEDLSDASICNITETGVDQCVLLLEENVLRAMDGFHIAAALEWKADLFVSSDGRQISAARKSGLQVKSVA